MDKITRDALCRMIIELEQRVEQARKLVLDTIGNRAAHNAASMEFMATLSALDRIEQILNGENE